MSSNTGMNILLTGGRAPVALELARMLAKAGHRVDLAESVPHHLCRKSKAIAQSFLVPKPNQDPEAYISALSRIIGQRNIQVLLPTCEEIFWIARGLAKLQSLCKVISAPLEQLKRLHSKWEFIRRAEAFGFAVPQTQIFHNTKEWANVCSVEHSWLDAGFVLKPVFSRFGANVQLFGPECSVADRLRRLQTNHGITATSAQPWIIQRYIKGRPLCTYSVAWKGIVVAHSAYEVEYTANRGACVYYQQLQHLRALNWVQSFVQKEHFSGQIAFDFVESYEDGILYPIECNPRATSGVHLFNPEDKLVEALIHPEDLSQQACRQPQTNQAAMLSIPMLAYGLNKERTWAAICHWWAQFVSARDVIWQVRDPLPFLEQIPLMLDAWRLSHTQAISITAAMTYDIEWNGEA
ncbi:ATP-grasp domain-containing protein [Paenibacillus sp. FSL H8-0034]|uniref:ATP-grasp domain-containing protein n=1 Tax=Paenibacillus sp. FSL H8-0034 TaxID=2954671 RepID=UPI0030F8160F